MYPEYSHLNQALSELGAVDAPTHLISPLINNFPLGILFTLFGVSVLQTFRDSTPAKVTGVLIVVHGVMSIAAGFFSCDAECNPESPSISQVVHNLAGLIMFLSLVVASGIWIYLSKRLLASNKLAWFSLLCTLVAVGVLIPMVLAIQSGSGFGVYQRINYGASVVWVAGLACFLFRRNSAKANNRQIR